MHGAVLQGAADHERVARTAGKILLGEHVEATSVALAPDASPREQLAAQELIDYLSRISGKGLARIEISDGKVPPGVIAVGRLAQQAKLVSREDIDAMARDGYVLRVAEGRAAVSGWRDLGTLYGAYALLRRLGVKFYARDCEIVPQVVALEIPEGILRARPRYDLRGFYALHRLFGLEPSAKLGHTPSDDHGNFNGPTAKDPEGHTSHFLVPYQEYGRDHPEYFALQKDGRRLRPTPGQPFNAHLCLSNAEVRRISARRLLDLMDGQNDRTFFVVTQGDGYEWCVCDACKALDAIPGDDMTDRLLDYVNDIARTVAHKHPDKIILTAAYTDATSRPPTRVLPEPNVRIVCCPYPPRCNCQSHDIICEKNRKSLDDIRGWLEKCPRQIYIFEYPRGYHCWYEPFGSFYAMARRMDRCAATTIGGIGFCGVPENFRDLFLFVMGRVLWEPQADVEPLVDEFMAVYYGKAAPAVREYFDFLHGEIDRGSVHQMCEGANTMLVTKEFAARALEMFSRAQSAVASDPARRARVDAEKFCVLWADVHQRNTVNKRLAVDGTAFNRRLGELIYIARDRKIERVGRTGLGLMPNWLSHVAGIKLSSEPWYNDPQVEQLVGAR